MLQTITHSCGHESEMDLKDSTGNEPGPRSLTKSVAFHSGRECKECWKSGKQAETDLALARFGELPELVGSEKQTGWAKVLRSKTLTAVAAWLDMLESDDNHLAVEEFLKTNVDVTDDMVAEYRANLAQSLVDRDATVALLVRVVDARFWIDTRDIGGPLADYRVGRIILESVPMPTSTVKFDLNEGKVFLSKRGKAKEVYSRRSNRYIMVGGNKFYDNEVELAVA